MTRRHEGGKGESWEVIKWIFSFWVRSGPVIIKGPDPGDVM